MFRINRIFYWEPSMFLDERCKPKYKVGVRIRIV